MFWPLRAIVRTAPVTELRRNSMLLQPESPRAWTDVPSGVKTLAVTSRQAAVDYFLSASIGDLIAVALDIQSGDEGQRRCSETQNRPRVLRRSAASVALPMHYFRMAVG
jgi:hypothetical protein